MRKIHFIKAHGLGNDFIIINQIDSEHYDLNEQEIKKLCNRNFGVGADQLVILREIENADCKMIIFNQDGTIAKACGNASRVITKLLTENKSEIKISSSNRMLHCQKINNNLFSVNMGNAHFEDQGNHVEVMVSKLFSDTDKQKLYSKMSIFQINLGNPHIVIFLKDPLTNKIMEHISKQIQSQFEDGINVHFAEFSSSFNRIILKSFERGAGLTLACGSGACATAYAAINSAIVKENNVIIQNVGGALLISKNSRNELIMQGPAEIVFEAEITI